MSSVQLTLAVAAALVLGLAGALKLVGDDALRYRTLGVAEIAIAVAALVPVSRVGGLLAGTALGLGFTAYALANDRPCRCFGERLQVVSRTARVFRAASVLVLCAGGLAASLGAAASADASWAVTPIVVGAAAGGLAVLLPVVLAVEIHETEEASVNV